MDYLLGREPVDSDDVPDNDTAIGDDGQFLALSYSGSAGGPIAAADDESTVKTQREREREQVKPKNTNTRKSRAKAVAVPASTENRHEEDVGIEATSSSDFQDPLCHMGCIREILGWNPDNVVVKVLAIAKPHEVKAAQGICEPMPMMGMPPLIMVGQVMSKTPSYCPVKFHDRVLALLPEDKLYSESYANLPFNSMMKLRTTLDPWQQISILLSYLPAFQILQNVPFPVSENRVLLNGGLGPVNQALIHLCHLHGARKVYVPVEDQYTSFARELGAKPLGPKHSDWGHLFVNSLDIVVDGIGENNFVTSKTVLLDSGFMVVVGYKDLDSKQHADFIYKVNKSYVDMRLNSSSRVAIFEYMKSFDTDREKFVSDFKYLEKLIWEEVLPVINTRVTLEDKDERRDTDALDGYDIIDIPQDNEWS